MSKTSTSARIIWIVSLAPTLAFAGTPGFSHQTSNAGLDGTGSGFFWINGAAVGDFNRDGFQDIFHASPGSGFNELFINNGDGTFTNQLASWGGVVASSLGYSASAADYNNDGYLDIYVSNYSGNAQQADALFRNNGDNTLTDVTFAAGINAPDFGNRVSSWGSAWGDYDLDGDLDLAICNWHNNYGNVLFMNNGDGTFTDVTISAGLSSLNGADRTEGFTVRFVDMNWDRYPEIMWIGDHRTGRYFINNNDGTFTESTESAGLNLRPSEMGMTVADYDLDGQWDMYVTYIGTGLTYLGSGANTFSLATLGTSDHPYIWGWGAVSIDFDHDNRVDVVTTGMENGSIVHGQTALQNQSTPTQLQLSNVTSQLNITNDEDGRGLANFDYDNDGDQDLIVISVGQVDLYRNDLTGPDTNWLRVFLDATGADDIPPDGIGSVIRVQFGGVERMGRIDGGNNFLSQSEMSAHFGLGAVAVVDELRVDWTNGATTILTNVAANQTLTIAACPPNCSGGVIGDVNCDAAVNGRDIAAFVLAMFEAAQFESMYPGCDRLNADTNGDTVVDLADIGEMVNLILGG